MCTTHRDLSTATVYGTFTDRVRIGRDGGVSIDGTGRIWLDCPTCGAQPPRTEAKIGHRWGTSFGGAVGRVEVTTHHARLEWLRLPYTKRNGKTGHETIPRGACSKCGATVIGRVITMRPAGSKAEECNGACLSGRRSCSCHCGGRCHGAGVCSCNGPDRAAPSIHHEVDEVPHVR